MVYWTGLSYPLKDGDFLRKEVEYDEIYSQARCQQHTDLLPVNTQPAVCIVARVPLSRRPL